MFTYLNMCNLYTLEAAIHPKAERRFKTKEIGGPRQPTYAN